MDHSLNGGIEPVKHDRVATNAVPVPPGADRAFDGASNAGDDRVVFERDGLVADRDQDSREQGGKLQG